MTTVKVEMSNRCQQIHFEHFLCARHHANPGEKRKWRQTEACLHRTHGLVDVGLQEELGSKQLRVPARFCSPETWSIRSYYKIVGFPPEGPRRPHSLAYPQGPHSLPDPRLTSPPPPLPYALCTIPVLEHLQGFHTFMRLHLLFIWMRHLFYHFLFLTKFYPFFKSKLKYYLKGSIASHLRTSL